MYEKEITVFIEQAWKYIGDNAAVLIALSALGLSIWQGISTRLHNKLSLKPHLTFDRSFDQNTPQITVLLENSGVGPAYIKSFKVFFDGIEQDVSDKSILMKLAQKMKVLQYYGGGKLLYVDDAIQTGKEVTIFRVDTTDKEKDENFDNPMAHEQLDRLDIHIAYSSAYGEEFILKLKNT